MAGGLALSVVTALACMARRSVRRNDTAIATSTASYTPFADDAYNLSYPDLYDDHSITMTPIAPFESTGMANTTNIPNPHIELGENRS